MTDTYRHKGMRRRLLEELRSKGISDEAVLNAMSLVPRHFFLEKVFEEAAYEDKALPIAVGQTISQPYTVAYQSQLLAVSPGCRVLEIGTGSGYQACVLAAMGVLVCTLERHEALVKQAQKMVDALGYSDALKIFFKDGYGGMPNYAPYDGIIVTCGAPEIPQTLLEQLAIGGRLVIPVGEGGQQRMLRVHRLSPTQFHTEEFSEFRFVPFLKGQNPQDNIPSHFPPK